MNIDLNKLPAGFALPATFQNKTPIGHPETIQVVVDEAAPEASYKCLCTDGDWVLIPTSALRDLKAEAEAEAAKKAADAATPAAAQ